MTSKAPLSQVNHMPEEKGDAATEAAVDAAGQAVRLLLKALPPKWKMGLAAALAATGLTAGSTIYDRVTAIWKAPAGIEALEKRMGGVESTLEKIAEKLGVRPQRAPEEEGSER